MTERDMSLAPRREDTREANPIEPPVQFSLEEIMRHFLEGMAEVRSQYGVADSLASSGNGEGCKTIWRSQVVLAEGLLDFYIHEISKYCLFRMFTGSWEKTEKYCAFPIRMVKVEEAIAAPESRDWFFAYLNERYSRDVFLSCESMREQLNMIGIGFSDTMVKAFPREKRDTSIKDGANIVHELFKRRNEIAHQNDRSHASAQKTDITREFVEDYIGKIESIVQAIQDIAQEKDRTDT